MKVNKHIWRFYTLFVVTSLLFFFIMMWYRISDVYTNSARDQANLVTLLNNVINSIFISQERLLHAVGYQLYSMGDDVSDGRGAELLDGVLDVEKNLIGFIYLDIHGNVLAASSNHVTQNDELSFLQEATLASFQHVLTTDQAVLGRTYFREPINAWIIPIRKRILNNAGEPVAVISAAYQLGSASFFFSQDIHQGLHHNIMLLRNSDWYLQYLSSNNLEPEVAYGYPSSPETLKKIESSMGISLENARNSPVPVEYFNALNRRGVPGFGMMKYNSRYELWILSEVSERYLLGLAIKVFLGYLPAILFLQLLAYILYRILSKVDQDRQKKLIFQATHDILTKLPNRNYLMGEIKKWILIKREFSLLFLDMDNFKGINDGFGHEYGDRVLAKIAQRLKSAIGRNDIVVRAGGDEFIIITDSDKESIKHLAEEISSLFDIDFTIDQFRFLLGVSIGISNFPEHGNDFDTLLRAADIAVYEAKKHKNSIRFFEPHMEQVYLRRIVIEQKLRNALANNELYVMYQPKVNRAGDLQGVEALARWNNEELGHVPPDQFISVAESTGLMHSIGQFILTTALAEMKEVQEVTGSDFMVSVNISVRQFFKENFLTDLLSIIERSGLNKNQICLEVTESVFIDDMAHVLEIMNSINGEGIKLSMDDFGTGYSSLSSLSQLPVNELKIDKSFVDNILSDIEARKMIQSIIAIGKNHGMRLIAEGVELEEQADMLLRFGCESYQGYFFSKPLTKDDLISFIRSKSTT